MDSPNERPGTAFSSGSPETRSLFEELNGAVKNFTISSSKSKLDPLAGEFIPRSSQVSSRSAGVETPEIFEIKDADGRVLGHQTLNPSRPIHDDFAENSGIQESTSFSVVSALREHLFTPSPRVSAPQAGLGPTGQPFEQKFVMRQDPSMKDLLVSDKGVLRNAICVTQTFKSQEDRTVIAQRCQPFDSVEKFRRELQNMSEEVRKSIWALLFVEIQVNMLTPEQEAGNLQNTASTNVKTKDSVTGTAIAGSEKSSFDHLTFVLQFMSSFPGFLDNCTKLAITLIFHDSATATMYSHAPQTIPEPSLSTPNMVFIEKLVDKYITVFRLKQLEVIIQVPVGTSQPLNMYYVRHAIPFYDLQVEQCNKWDLFQQTKGDRVAVLVEDWVQKELEKDVRKVWESTMDEPMTEQKPLSDDVFADKGASDGVNKEVLKDQKSGDTFADEGDKYEVKKEDRDNDFRGDGVTTPPAPKKQRRQIQAGDGSPYMTKDPNKAGKKYGLGKRRGGN